jgi:hypothetical protein
MALPKLKRPEAEPQPNVVRGPWDQPAQKGVPRKKSPPRASRQGKREPIVNNWKLLLLMFGLLFVLPPVATWLIHRIAHLVAGAG